MVSKQAVSILLECIPVLPLVCKNLLTGDCLGEYNEHITKVSDRKKGVDHLVKVTIDHRIHCNVSAGGAVLARFEYTEFFF